LFNAVEIREDRKKGKKRKEGVGRSFVFLWSESSRKGKRSATLHDPRIPGKKEKKKTYNPIGERKRRNVASSFNVNPGKKRGEKKRGEREVPLRHTSKKEKPPTGGRKKGRLRRADRGERGRGDRFSPCSTASWGDWGGERKERKEEKAPKNAREEETPTGEWEGVLCEG